MKKFMTIALVALLAVSSVFAGFSGSATAGLIADIDNEVYGFTGASGDFTLKFNANTLAGASKGEGDVYAEIAATAKISTDAKIEHGDDGAEVKIPVKAAISLDTLKIAGKEWSVDLTGAQGAANLAQDWYTAGGKNANLDFALAAVPGVTVDVYGYKVGVGFLKDDAGTAALLTANTKTFDFDGLKLTAGVGMAKEAAKGTMGLDVSAKTAYANEDLKLSASVATDVVMNVPVKEGADFSVDADVLANVAYDFVALNAYYATNAKLGYAGNGAENYYTVGLSFDFTGLFAPVTLDLNVLNIKKNAGEFSAEAAYSFGEEVGSVSVNGGYKLADEKWNVGADADYTFDKIGTVAGGFALKGANEVTDLNLNVSFSNDTLINNATLALAYESGNLLADKAEIGSIFAGVTVAF